MTIDMVAPAPGVLSFSSDFSDTGQSATDRISSDAQFSLVYVPASQVVPGAVSSSDDGNWSYVFMASVDGSNWYSAAPGTASSLSLDLVSLSLPDYQYYFRALVSDAAGNTVMTPTLGYQLDRVLSSAGQISLGNFVTIAADQEFTLSLTGQESGARFRGVLEVDLPDGSDGNFVTAADMLTIGSLINGEYSVSLGQTGSYVFRAVVEDLAGNSGYAQTVGVILGTSNNSQFMRLPDTLGVAGGGNPILSDSPYDMLIVDLSPGPKIEEFAEARALALGEALAAYLNPEVSSISARELQLERASRIITAPKASMILSAIVVPM
ncbi:MAG: hypothetical protein EB017_15145 [Betaproteobacteria bacterium]|nr:hypothetical protein [Betaproteobacteria bacterium]